jgi:hypothetical protein
MVVTLVDGVILIMTVWVTVGTMVVAAGAVTFATSVAVTIAVVATGTSVVGATVATVVAATVCTVVGIAVVTGAGFACWVHPLTATRTRIKMKSPITFFIADSLNSPDN